jgi:serine/threonine protein kinase/WD40 repeat protein
VPGYDILAELGRGGMGVVYQARQVGLDRLVALKVVLAGAQADAEERARFRREAEAIARLHHPNVVAIYEVGDQGGVPHFAMELCGGGSLAQQLAGSPLPPRRAAELVETLARAVQAAHEAGVVHRDLKPANVLLTEDGTPKITDFGLAKKLDDTGGLTATGVIVGTASYMAPEQASGDSKRVGPAADVYALGAVLYACLTGRPPFRAATQVDTLLQVVADPPVPPSRLRQGVPGDLEALCLRCLEKKPAQRPASAAELADALRRFLDGLPAQVRPHDERPRQHKGPGCLVRLLQIHAILGALVLPPVYVMRALGPDTVAGWAFLLLYASFATLIILFWLSRQGGKHVFLLAFSPDGNTLASAAGGNLKVWDIAWERLCFTLELDPAPPLSAKGIVPWLAHALRTIQASGRWIRAAGFTPDGQTLMTLDYRGEVRLWGVADGCPKGKFQLACRVAAAAFTPDCRTLATVAVSRLGTRWMLTLWDVDLAGAVSRRVAVPVPEHKRSPEFGADGRLLSLMTKGGLQLWEVNADGLRERPLPDFRDQRVVKISPDGRLAALLGESKMEGRPVTLWDLAADRACGGLPPQHTGEDDWLLEFVADSRLVVSLGEGGLYLWDALAGRRLGNVQPDGGEGTPAMTSSPPRGPLGLLTPLPVVAHTTILAFSPDGRTLATGDSAGQVSWHDVEAIRRSGRSRSGQETESQRGHPPFAQPPSPAAVAADPVLPGPAEEPVREDEPALAGPPASANPVTCATVPPAEQGDQVGERPPPTSSPEPPAVPLPGTFPEVPGYEVLGVLGQGGMGVVYKARQVGLNRFVALKVLLGGAHAGGDERARFRREAEAIARLHHSNVVRIYEVGEHAGLSYFSMELCAGGSLEQRLAGGPLPPPEAARLAATLARAVHAAHEAGVIHRDLKPANVLLADDGTPRITDFGLAKRLDAATELTASGVVLGTPSYMAPEQAGGRAREVGPAADVYALGAILYACLTGRPPFQAATPINTVLQVLADPPVPPSRLRRQVPAALETICLKCLAKDPRHRYPSAAALADQLERPRAESRRAVKRRLRDPGRKFWLTVRRDAQRLQLPAALLLLAAAVASFTAGWVWVGCLALPTGVGLGCRGIVVWRQTRRRARRRVLALAFRPDGRALAVGRADGSPGLVDLDSEEMGEPAEGFEPTRHRPAVRALAFRTGKGGEEVAVLDAAGALRLWDLTTPPKAEPVLTVGRVATAALSPDGRWLACATGGRPRVWLWDLASEPRGISLDTDARLVSALVFAPSGPAFAARTETGLRLYRLGADGRLVEQPLAGGEVEPRAVPAFTPDGGSLVVRRRDGTLQAWEVATRRPRDEVKGRANGLAVVFAPDGRSAVTLNADGTASLWDLATSQEQAVLEMDRPSNARNCSPDDADDKERAVLEMDRPSNVSVFAPAPAGQGPKDLLQQGVRRAAFSPDGRTLALADGVGGVAWCDVAEVRRIAGFRPGRERTREDTRQGEEASMTQERRGSEGAVPFVTISVGGRPFAVESLPLPRPELMPGVEGGAVKPAVGPGPFATLEQPDGHSLLLRPEDRHYRRVLRRFSGGVGGLVLFGAAAAVGLLRPGLLPLVGGCLTALFAILAGLCLFWLLLLDFSMLFGGRRVHFDANLRWMTFGPFWARQRRPLTDIVAVQLVSETVPERLPPSRERLPKTAATTRYQLNLVLDDPDLPRINVVDRDDRAWVEQAGKQLAEFLAVPLLDQIPGTK